MILTFKIYFLLTPENYNFINREYQLMIMKYQKRKLLKTIIHISFTYLRGIKVVIDSSSTTQATLYNVK